MKKLEVLKYPHIMLNTICDKYEFDPVNNMLLTDALNQMATLMDEHKGMGLAANQVGLPFRFFIMRPLNEEKIIELVNPVWEPVGEEKARLYEGCLSAPNVSEAVPGRFKTVKVKYYDRHGFEEERVFTGLDAVCVQHEVDHLDGIFWVDKLPRDLKRKVTRRMK